MLDTYVLGMFAPRYCLFLACIEVFATAASSQNFSPPAVPAGELSGAAVSISTVMVFLDLTASGEILAFYSAGVSLARAARAPLILVILISLLIAILWPASGERQTIAARIFSVSLDMPLIAMSSAAFGVLFSKRDQSLGGVVALCFSISILFATQLLVFGGGALSTLSLLYLCAAMVVTKRLLAQAQ